MSVRRQSLRRVAGAWIALALAGSAAAQPVLLGDLAPSRPGSELTEPRDVRSLGGVAVFTAETRHGRELWRTDGTAAGTVLLADLCPGTCSGHPAPLGTVGGQLLFSAGIGLSAGRGWLLQTDGTVAGTQPVAGPLDEVKWLGSTGEYALLEIEVAEPAEDRLPGGLVAYDPNGGDLVVVASSPDVNPSQAVESGDRVFLAGNGIWVSDGTAAGTRRIARETALLLTPLAGGAAFWRPSGELMLTDGGEPRVLAQGEPFGTFDEALEAVAIGDGRVLFKVVTQGRVRLWLTDGTALGTRRLEIPAIVGEVGGVGGRAYFVGGDAAGLELWTSDGTPVGTRRVADLCPGSCSARPRDFTPFADGVLFTAEDERDGQPSLWFVAGGSAPRRVRKAEARLTALGPTLPVGDELFLVWDFRLWRMDRGLRLDAIRETGADSLTAVGRWVLFDTASDLWRTDGTASGTAALPLDVSQILDGSHPSAFVPFHGRACFLALGDAWCADGLDLERVATTRLGFERLVPAGSRLFAVGRESLVRILGGAPEELLNFDRHSVEVEPVGVLGEDVLFFVAAGTVGLWRSDGTVAGTRLVRGPLRPPPAGLRPASAVVPVGGRVLFVASGFEGEIGVWGSDGTFEGTVELPVDVSRFEPVRPVAFRGAAWFAADGRLWRSDGTVAGTEPVFDLPPLEARSGIDLFAIGSRLLMLGHRFPVREVWSTDGGAPPQKVFDLDRSGGWEAAALGGRLFFATLHPDLGHELWVTDGTAEGTSVLDVLPGPLGSAPTRLTAAGDHLLFAARHLDDGHELWITDGTPAGTRRVVDLAPGPSSSSPAEMTRVGDRLYFAADDGTVGQEPWAVDWEWVLASGGPCEPSETRLCLGGGRFAVTVRWRDHINGGAGSGRALTFPASDATGVFWFFDPGNVELIVKALDGTSLNGHHWLFYGALSTVEYAVDVTDTATGTTRRYHNPAGEQCGRGDTGAFPGALGAPGTVAGFSTKAAPASACGDEAIALCLLGGSLTVEVDWHDPRSGDRGRGVPIAGSDNTGYFWFFDAANVELVVKALDGTTVNGHRWVFYGGLSDVEYEIRVTERATGAVRTYRNPFGEICGGSDTAAF